MPPELQGPAALLAEPGPGAYTITAGRIEGEFGHPVGYETYMPAEVRSEVMVILAHGFMRDLSSMRGWAALWASYGLRVTVMSLGNSTWFNGRHDRNAVDLQLLARSIHNGPVLYAGFSAGGLAAFVAAGRDERAVAYLGLDPVDSGSLAADNRHRLTVPALFLLAEASSCNAKNNILEAIPERSGLTTVRVQHAIHCHFENPTDSACESVCGRVEPPEAGERITARIRSLATAWVLKQTGVTP
jgi:hypothetical protein